MGEARRHCEHDPGRNGTLQQQHGDEIQVDLRFKRLSPDQIQHRGRISLIGARQHPRQLSRNIRDRAFPLEEVQNVGEIVQRVLAAELRGSLVLGIAHLTVAADVPPPGYRPRAPAPEALVDWPAAFGTRFTVLVDTEEEFDWNAPLTRSAHGVSAMAALPAAHRRFADRGVPLTYMIDYPIATDARASAVLATLLEDGVSAVGTQLHPWVNPPFDEPLTPANSYAGNLPEAIEAAKLDALTDAITRAVGVRPIAYRAGRYGIGPNTLRLLAERGSRVGSSMRSRYGYAADGGPDFAEIGNHAFRAGPAGAMLELPLTTIHTGWLRRGGTRLYRGLGAVPRGGG
eukprot:gene22977-24300_t